MPKAYRLYVRLYLLFLCLIPLYHPFLSQLLRDYCYRVVHVFFCFTVNMQDLILSERVKSFIVQRRKLDTFISFGYLTFSVVLRKLTTEL